MQECLKQIPKSLCQHTPKSKDDVDHIHNGWKILIWNLHEVISIDILSGFAYSPLASQPARRKRIFNSTVYMLFDGLRVILEEKLRKRFRFLGLNRCPNTEHAL
jgi:hypothetical protein